MAIESNKRYLLIYVSISFKNNLNFLKKLKKEFGFDIPYVDIPCLSEELRSVLDSYIYLEESLVVKNIFSILYQKYKQVSFTDLGYIEGKEIYKLVNSCVSDALNSIKVGEYYKIIKHSLKNLIIKVVHIGDYFVVGEYTVLDKIKRVEIPIANISSFDNIYQVERDSQFINYMELGKKMGEKKAIIVDGHNILYRSMFGYNNKYTAKDRIFVGGAFGMYFSLLKLKELYPEYEIHLVFDGYDTIKFQENPTYKIHRQKYPYKFREAAKNNLRWVKEFAFCLGFNVYHLSDKEGDDVIGSIVSFLETYLKYDSILIHSTDKDFYSLVSDVVNLYMPRVEFRGTSKKINRVSALEKFGVNEIFKINWSKSISGDESDNIITVNLFNHDNKVKCSQVKKKDYLPVINQCETYQEVKRELIKVKKFKKFIESGQIDRNFKLLTINTSLFKTKPDLNEFKGICSYDKAVKLLEEFSFYKELEMFEKNFRIFRGIW